MHLSFFEEGGPACGLVVHGINILASNVLSANREDRHDHLDPRVNQLADHGHGARPAQ